MCAGFLAASSSTYYVAIVPGDEVFSVLRQGLRSSRNSLVKMRISGFCNPLCLLSHEAEMGIVFLQDLNFPAGK